MMAGDMHVSPPDMLDRVAAALAGARASDDGDLGQRIASVLEAPDVHQADATTGVTTDDLFAALRKAVDNAKEAPA
jgi:lipoate---protein ligase